MFVFLLVPSTRDLALFDADVVTRVGFSLLVSYLLGGAKRQGTRTEQKQNLSLGCSVARFGSGP